MDKNDQILNLLMEMNSRLRTVEQELTEAKKENNKRFDGLENDIKGIFEYVQKHNEENQTIKDMVLEHEFSVRNLQKKLG